MLNLIFVYGTLMISENEFAEFLKRNSTFVSSGKVRGCLYDLGAYPGAVFNSKVDSYVVGKVFLLQKTEEVLARLDYYEGIGQQGCEYTRSLIEVETDESTKLCWAYCYKLPVERLKLISNGDYLEYLKNKYL